MKIFQNSEEFISERKELDRKEFAVSVYGSRLKQVPFPVQLSVFFLTENGGVGISVEL